MKEAMTEIEKRIKLVMDHLPDWEKRHGMFSFPLDAFSHEPWGYHLHVLWVTAWNATGRAQPATEHLRKWLTPERFIEPLPEVKL